MRGQSLVGWLNRDGQGEGEGLAFCQYFERNSVFKPLRHGTVGVIDGQYQYVVYLDTQKGELRPLNEAQIWNLDRSAENPARAKALRAAIHSRFPELRKNQREPTIPKPHCGRLAATSQKLERPAESPVALANPGTRLALLGDGETAGDSRA